MLRLKNLRLNGHILFMTVLVEGDENRAYQLWVDADTEWFTTIKSDVPDEYRTYECQAKMALRRYKNQDFPENILSMWY